MITSSIRPAIGVAAALVLALSGCSGSQPVASSGSSASGATSASTAFPATVDSCGDKLVLDKAPERVLLMGGTDASALAELDVLDKVVVRVGNLEESAYSPEVAAKLKAIPQMEAGKLETGGSKVSTEAVLAQKVDLVVGYDTGVDRAALKAAGVHLYSPDAFCPDAKLGPASFALATKEVDKVAAIFGVPDRAKQVNARLEADIAKLSKSTKRGTAAALYITPGSKTFYAYGPASMIDPIMTTNGLVNAYADGKERVFDASMEDLVKRNPDHIVVLYGEGKADEAKSTFLSFNGAKELTAVQKNQVEVLAFTLTDPPSPLSVQGATALAKELEKK